MLIGSHHFCTRSMNIYHQAALITRPSPKAGWVLKWARFVRRIIFEGGRLPVLCWFVGAPPICHQHHLAKIRTNYIRFISKLWCAWGSKWNCWSRDRFKWRCRWWISPQAVLFCSEPDNATENLSLRRRSRKPSRVVCLWRNFRVWSWGS